jgi:hypothetical protein
VTGEWRKLHNEELHNLYSSPDIIRQVKSRRMRWAGHVTRLGEEYTRFWWESPKERDHSEDQGVGGKMGSECILGRLARGVWIGFDWLRTETGGELMWWTFGFLRHGISYLWFSWPWNVTNVNSQLVSNELQKTQGWWSRETETCCSYKSLK